MFEYNVFLFCLTINALKHLQNIILFTRFGLIAQMNAMRKNLRSNPYLKDLNNKEDSTFAVNPEKLAYNAGYVHLMTSLIF